MKKMELNIQKFASGTIVFDNWNSGIALRGKIEWESTPISGQNKSSVYAGIYARRTTSTTKGRTWHGNLNIGGNNHTFSQIYTGTSTTVGTEWVLIEYWTDTITHSADGTKTIEIWGEVYGPDGTSLENKSTWGSGYATLDRLHASPVLNSVSFTETNTALTNIGITDNQFVPYLSQKNISMNMTLSNNATLSSINWNFKNIELDTSKTISILSTSETPPASTGTFTYTKTIDFANQDLPYTLVSGTNYTKVGYTIIDSMTSSYITPNNDLTQYEIIPYKLPSLTATSTYAKRDGQTSGKVNLTINGTFYNGNIGNTANGINVYYKFWEKTASEPSTYIQVPSGSVTISENNLSVSNYPIGSTSTSATNYFDYQKSYYIQVKITDTMGQTISLSENISVPVGEATWSEYPDYVDFKALTIKGKQVPINCITLSAMASDASLSSGNVTKLTLKNQVKSTNSKFSLSSGGVKIGSGVTKVKVSASVYFTTTTTRCNAYIYKNNTSTQVARGIQSVSGNGYHSVNITPKVIEVQENDVLYLYVMGSGGSSSVSNDNSMTYLTVEEVI